MRCTHEGCESDVAITLRVKLGPGDFQWFEDYASCKAHAELRAGVLKESLAGDPRRADAIQSIPYRAIN